MWYRLNPVTGNMPVPLLLLLKWKHYMLGNNLNPTYELSSETQRI